MGRIHTRAPRTIWTWECLYPDGSLKWIDENENLVTDEGITDLIETYFKKVAHSAAWYVALVNQNPVFAATDKANSHPGWSENVQYSQATRSPLVLGAMANKTVNNAGSKSQFTMSANATIAGSALFNNSVKGSVTGILYSEVAFLSGNKVLLSGEILNASVVLTGA